MAKIVLAGVRVGPVRRPAMLLAFPDECGHGALFRFGIRRPCKTVSACCAANLSMSGADGWELPNTSWKRTAVAMGPRIEKA